MARIFLAAVGRWAAAVILVACGVGGGSGCAPKPVVAFGSGLAPVPANSAIQQRERAMFERLNRDRARQGLAALRLDPRLSEIARHHSADMRDHGFFEHESPRSGSLENRLDAASYSFLTARENLSEAPDVERSEDGLLASPPHYANIMAKDVTHVGIGIVEGGVKDATNLSVTQVFATPLTPESPARAESEIVQRIRKERDSAGKKAARRDPQLGELAARYIAEVDEAGSPESVQQAGDGIAGALDGKRAGQLVISAQVVPGSAQLHLPDALTVGTSATFGLAARRVHGKGGRPALLVLLIALEAAK